MAQASFADRVANKVLEACKERTEGWEEEESNEDRPILLLSENEFAEQFLSQSLLDSFRQAAQHIPEQVSRTGGVDYNNTADAFRVLFSDDAIQTLVDITNGYLRKHQIYPSTNPTEYREFLAHKLLWSRYDAVCDEILPCIAEKHGFHAMNPRRFRALYQCTHGYAIEDHDKSLFGDGNDEDEDEAWLGKRPILRKMEGLERKLFEPSMKFMLNQKSGLLVVNNEQLSWRNKKDDDYYYYDEDSNDYEAGAKNRPSCDYISDALTGVRLGMRIRIGSEYPLENVEGLLNVLPDITTNSSENQIRVCLDEEYGMMPFLAKNLCERNYNVTTRACPLYSRHPFVTNEEVEHLQAEWDEAQISEQVKQKASDMLQPFLMDGDDRIGSNVRVATKVIALPNGETKRITATATRDKFDSRQTCQFHCFFSSDENEKMSDIWVTKEEAGEIFYTTLFKERKSPLPIEIKLLEACCPITLEQQSADWYLQRAFRLSGTAAEQTFFQSQSDSSETVEGDTRISRMQKCLDSWFGRHPSTQVVLGDDEEPLINELRRVDWITEVYDIGLVEWKKAPFIAVSPDGVAEFCVDNTIHHACIEIKKRTDWAEVEDAEDAATDHGSTVHCKFGDDVFKECVPPNDRHQVLQQAIVTGLDYGIFVTSKQDSGEEESIVQIVVVKILESDKRDVSEFMLRVGDELVGWIYEEAIMTRGYLMDTDFPHWLASTSGEAKLIKSQYRLWVAQYKKIRADGVTYIPARPLYSYEYSAQHLYNQAKKGLGQKHKEACQHFSIDIKASLETKYVFQMIDAIFYNHWRFAQGIDKVLPYLASDETKTVYDKVKERMQEYEFGRHSFRLAIDFLVKSEIDKRIDREVQRRLSQQDSANQNEAEVLREVEKLRRKRKFPVVSKRPQIFHREPILKKLRLTQTAQHMPVNKGKEYYGKSCALCGVCRTSFWCEICCVPLCAGEHFTLWHTADNLLETHNIEKAEALRAKEQASARRGKNHAASGNSDSASMDVDGDSS